MSKIEWTDESWNPIVGCSIVSPGCTNCYAMRMAARLEKMLPPERRGDAILPNRYAASTKPSKAGPVWTGRVTLAPDRTFTEPLRRRKATTYFVNSMGDLFHESVPDVWIDRVFAVMALAPQHSFVVLTKRAKRMREYLTSVHTPLRWVKEASAATQIDPYQIASPDTAASWLDNGLPNVILGVSAERQQEADERIPDLLATPAAKRVVSIEPMLGPIAVSRYMWPVCASWPGPYRSPEQAKASGADVTYHRQALVSASARFLDGVIVGGESGHSARPMHPDWARAIRDQCAAAGVPFFFKQWGEWGPEAPAMRAAWDSNRSRWHEWLGEDGLATAAAVRVGKSRAGRRLDGREHNDLPWTLSA